MNRWLFLWRRVRAQIWFRASLYAAFGVGAALVAVFAAPFVPRAMADRLGGESVQQILTILASSLLAVATFSLGAWVTAYTSVSQAATPRAAALVTSDEASQKSLATFVGAFLYAVVAVTAVNAHYYGPGGRAVLYLTSLAVVGLVAFRLLGWINRLSRLARLGHMIELVEERTAACLAQEPPTAAAPPLTGAEVRASRTGYVQNIDLPYLQELAGEHDLRVEILAPVGAFRRRGEVLARTSHARLDTALEERLAEAFAVARGRTFDQDPRYGLIVLGEIGARALSPGVNDPGTAIQIVGVAVRLLDDWSRLEPTRPEDDQRVFRPPLAADALLDDVLGPLIRYGSTDLALAIRLQKALRSLASGEGPVSTAARALAADALSRAKAELHPQDRRRLAGAAREGG
ncbi:DUF2254 domain-containing protein [Brevundimonas sp. FT23042]|uniref:DUF2254 domain-containing protein n=1 Tax=Brevundimonas sp. FT23042 TaxID=3393749 RepID=UPI003B589D56